MYRSVLVPLDGSRFAEHALPAALSIARRAGARLLLVQVRQPRFVPRRADFTPDPGESYLCGVVRRLSALAPVAVESALLEGPAAGVLCEHAEAAGADLVVMTTHGRGPLSRFWLGSVADELARRLPMPVLLLRPREDAPDLSGEPEFRHLLVPLDGSPWAEGVLGPALALGALWGSQVTLARVVTPVPVVGVDVTGYAAGTLDLAETERRAAEARTYLERVAARFHGRPPEFHTAALIHEHPAPGILEAAQARGADLIALATHGRGGLKRLVFGSVADKVLRGTSTPLLLYRPLEIP